MELAISEAKKGEGFVHPNPLVGAVIVKDEKVLAVGYHHNYGNLHAERDALKNARENGIDVTDATIYVTLEPCCHHGKQPPCTQAIVESGIKKVVIGSRDPNPLVNGKGVEFLKENGIEVVQDFMKDECDEMNRVFFHYIQQKTPYVILKYAMTADGETCCSTGESQWITGKEARKNVHLSRSNVMAVMTGINTVIKDDPMLNVRLEDGENHFQPTPIVCDSNLKIPMESYLVEHADVNKLIIACKEDLDDFQQKKKVLLEEKGVRVISLREKNGSVDLEMLLRRLGEMGIDSVFVESGGVLSGSLFFEKNLVNQIDVYVGAQIFGNTDGKCHSPVQKKGVDFPKDSVKLSKPTVEMFGNDVLLRYFVEK